MPSLCGRGVLSAQTMLVSLSVTVHEGMSGGGGGGGVSTTLPVFTVMVHVISGLVSRSEVRVRKRILLDGVLF